MARDVEASAKYQRLDVVEAHGDGLAPSVPETTWDTPTPLPSNTTVEATPPATDVGAGTTSVWVPALAVTAVDWAADGTPGPPVTAVNVPGTGRAERLLKRTPAAASPPLPLPPTQNQADDWAPGPVTAVPDAVAASACNRAAPVRAAVVPPPLPAIATATMTTTTPTMSTARRTASLTASPPCPCRARRRSSWRAAAVGHAGTDRLPEMAAMGPVPVPGGGRRCPGPPGPASLYPLRTTGSRIPGDRREVRRRPTTARTRAGFRTRARPNPGRSP